MNKKFIKINIEEISKLDDNSLNVLVGGAAGSNGKSVLETILDSLDIHINWNCKCTHQTNNVC